MNRQPIGILDSGVGGLTVWKEIIKQLPHESTIYIGDSLKAPYGSRNSSEIVSLAKKLIDFLLKHKAKLIVIACNTITLNGIDKIREAFPKIPIIGTVPVIKGAANTTKTKRIGLLATTAGAQSDYVKNLIQEFASSCTVTVVASDEIVPLIEKGESATNKMKDLLQKELLPLQKAEIDTLVLGSTHFPFIKEQIQVLLGSSVTLLDSGPAIARQVVRVLSAEHLLSTQEKPSHVLYTTGDKEQFSIIASGMIEMNNNITIEKV